MTPQRAREILNQFAHCSEFVRSALLAEEGKGEKMTRQEPDDGEDDEGVEWQYSGDTTNDGWNP